jgi:tRNA threonylcarbamoyladenosine biosynthesis protein TsaB
MAVALDIPVIAITTLEAVVAPLAGVGVPIRVGAFDARRRELYLQVFKGEGLAPATEPQVLAIDAAARVVADAAAGQGVAVAGTGAGLLTEAMAEIGVAADAPAVEGHPDAGHVARLAADRDVTTIPPAPLYLRAPDAKIPEPK